MKEPVYSIHVYEDYAIIRGGLTSDILTMLIKLCKKEGFTHITSANDGKEGFKLVRK
jgi:hypothetical protein